MYKFFVMFHKTDATPHLPLLPLLLIFRLHKFFSFVAQTYLGIINRSESEIKINPSKNEVIEVH